MTDEIVDCREAVEVDVHDSQLAAGTPQTKQRRTQAIAQQRTVGKPGQGVVEGQTLDEVFGALALGEVDDDAHPASGLPDGVEKAAPNEPRSTAPCRR